MKLPVIKPLIVALAGNPNSGKTTLFNALTGLRQKVANYPGVTVEKKVGKCQLESGQVIDVIDLPGAYSLISRSPDELVAMQVLRGLRLDTPAPDVVICVVDASNLQRNLYLVSQLIELGRPMIVALNMTDIAERRGIHVSTSRLSSELGVPVVSIVGHKKQGIDELKRAILRAVSAPIPKFPLGQEMAEELQTVGAELESYFTNERTINGEDGTPIGLHHEPRTMFLAERLLIGDHAVDLDPYRKDTRIKSLVDKAHDRLTRLGIDPMQADIEAHYRWIDDVAARSLEPACAALEGSGLRGQGSEKEGLGVRRMGLDDAFLSPLTPDPSPLTPTLDYAHLPTLTERLDRVFLHKIWGIVTFAAIMAALFISIFIIADPLMGATEGAVSWLGSLVTDLLPEGAIRDLWSDGIVAGVGGVLVFVPQIAVLFLFLAILEDSGYLARAAFLMDRVLGKLGLNGKSFIPLLSSFACAIPGIMAARTIENRKDRLATIFVAPFMSCSARLPVYGLLIGAFFASYSAITRGGIMFACYALGIIAAVITAVIFRKTFLKSAPTSFVLELPTYKVPQIMQIIRVMWTNTMAFVRKAGTIIFCLSVILWAMAYYPRLGDSERSEVTEVVKADFDKNQSVEFLNVKADSVKRGREAKQRDPAMDFGTTLSYSVSHGSGLKFKWDADGTLIESHPSSDEVIAEKLAAAQLEQSISGRLGHFIEPVIKPLGYDWKMGVGLIASFAAREVFVAQMGIVYAAGDMEDDQSPLASAMLADRDKAGNPVWTAPVAISLLVWFVLAMQCMSTVAIVRRETGTWSWAIGQLVYMNVLAYACAFIAYQVCLRLM